MIAAYLAVLGGLAHTEALLSFRAMVARKRD